jgi:small subunit ribosomal protein S2
MAAGAAASGVDLGASVAPIEPTLARELTPEPVTEAASEEIAATEAAMTAPAAEAASEEPAAS